MVGIINALSGLTWGAVLVSACIFLAVWVVLHRFLN